MSAVWLILISLIVLGTAYRWHGRFLIRRFGIDPERSTPANTLQDGVDYVPTKPFVLLGHHFASIAGAGPILGPVFAATFGWGPVFLWIIIGVIFIGGVHDFASLIASIRHGGQSIGEVIEAYIGKNGKRLFLIFTWLMLILIIAVFAKTVAATFVKTPAAATSSFLFIALALLFGLATYRFHLPFGWATVIGVSVLLLCVFLGTVFPVHLSESMWIYILFAYIFLASVTPVWILLQPRDFLNSFLLYFILLGSVVGIFFARPQIIFPVFTAFDSNLGTLFPILFVTVACGSISGFHSLVASGTTSKQLNSEKDVRPIGYGSMLIEAVLAIVALITAVLLTPAEYRSMLTREGGGPITIFASGVGGFLSHLGVPVHAGITFAALAISAFAMTTLDTATRLGRFVFQEMFDDLERPAIFKKNRYLSTGITIGGAAILTFSGTGQTLWPLFGSANQLLAALALLAVTVWLAETGKKNLFVKIPMLFMLAVTLVALITLIMANIRQGNFPLLVIGLFLFLVAAVMVILSWKKLRRKESAYG